MQKNMKSFVYRSAMTQWLSPFTSWDRSTFHSSGRKCAMKAAFFFSDSLLEVTKGMQTESQEFWIVEG